MDHSGEKVKFWCKKCQILVCCDCLLYQHLNLTTVQDIYIKRMLNSTDPMQILKLKSALYRNYNVFVEKYNTIDDGY
jgi:hypothetical protein